MKVAFLCSDLGIVYRGAETYVHQLANHLVDRGLGVKVYQGGPALEDSKYQSIGNTVKLTTDIDVVIPTGGRAQAIMARLWTSIHGKKLVISGQSGPGIDDRINLFCFPDRFVGLTDFQCNWARRANPLVRIEKIPNGVDVNKFTPKVKPISLNLPSPVVLNVGALVPQKRQELLISAVAKMGNASLVLVGRGPDENRLAHLGQEMLGDRFKIVHKDFSDMPSVYTAADVFAFPTVPWESFGIAMLEAMASGLPVVATDDPIRREIVGSSGRFVNPEDSDKFAKVLNDALGAKLSTQSRSQAEKFSWATIADQYLLLLTKLCSQSQ